MVYFFILTFGHIGPCDWLLSNCDTNISGSRCVGAHNSEIFCQISFEHF